MHRRHPRAGARRRVPVVVHRRLPRRGASASTTSCCRSSARPSSTGPGSSRSRPRTARPPRRSTDAVDAELAVEWLRECEAVQEPITRAARDALVGRRGRGARRRPSTTTARSSAAPTVRRRRSTASCGSHADWARPGRARCARTSPRRSVPTSSPRLPRDAPRRASSAPRRRSAFGDDAIATPANLVTIARWSSRSRRSSSSSTRARRGSPSPLWFVLTTTDGLDGWLARRDGTTRSGAFLDPLADKFLVLGGFFALGDQRRLLVGRGDHRDRARGRRLDVPVVRGEAGDLAARASARASGRRSSSSSRSASCSCRPRTSGRRSTTSSCGSRSALSVVSGLDIVISGSRQTRKKGTERHAV